MLACLPDCNKATQVSHIIIYTAVSTGSFDVSYKNKTIKNNDGALNTSLQYVMNKVYSPPKPIHLQHQTVTWSVRYTSTFINYNQYIHGFIILRGRKPSRLNLYSLDIAVGLTHMIHQWQVRFLFVVVDNYRGGITAYGGVVDLLVELTWTSLHKCYPLAWRVSALMRATTVVESLTVLNVYECPVDVGASTRCSVASGYVNLRHKRVRFRVDVIVLQSSSA